MASTSFTLFGDASPTPYTPPDVIGTTTSPTTLTTEPVEPTSTTTRIEITSTTTATPTEPSPLSTTATTTITTKPPTISTTITTKQILSPFITIMRPSTSIPNHASLLSAEISLVPVLTANSGHSSSAALITTSLNSDFSSTISDFPSITSDTPLPTSDAHSTTSNITISRILPAVLVPIACLIAILLAVLFIRRSRRRIRQKRAMQTPLPFISQIHSPGLSSALSTNRDRVINADEKSPRYDSDIGSRGIVGNGGLGNEGELRTREETSVHFLGGNNTLPGLREQIFILQAQLADIENQHISRAPPGYSSIHGE